MSCVIKNKIKLNKTVLYHQLIIFTCILKTGNFVLIEAAAIYWHNFPVANSINKDSTINKENLAWNIRQKGRQRSEFYK